MTKSRLAATGLLALAFALGGLAGATATMMADNDHPPLSPHGKTRAAYIAQMRQEFVDQLKHELALTASQERSVNQILDRHQPAMDSLWRSVRTQFEAERQAVRQEIGAMLAPGQQSQYQSLLAKRDSTRRAREESGDDHK
jgi:Spy/CpxP family protein refolding chaperone